MRLRKKLLKFAIWFIVVGVFGLCSTYFYLKSTWRDVLSEEELDELVARIEFADDLPERFFELYEEAYPGVMTTTLNKQMMKSVFSNDVIKSPSLLASTISKLSRVDGDSTRISRRKAYVLAWKLEEVADQKQCLNWALKNYQFTPEFKGVDNIARYYYVKDLHSLNDEELKSIITLMKKPSLVSIPKRGPLGTYITD
ncbi:transglycosylase domain-containing protein [Seonamhaeicola sp.]|uniref:transglycosylase domain-containing protein n=1 Tax=Seonamhaeicola sp. TaxID=1912245 RepID=UPI0026221724|nr:transglycosylase domain-containing protein [Seonamhaeicola sp.]